MPHDIRAVHDDGGAQEKESSDNCRQRSGINEPHGHIFAASSLDSAKKLYEKSLRHKVDRRVDRSNRSSFRRPLPAEIKNGQTGNHESAQTPPTPIASLQCCRPGTCFVGPCRLLPASHDPSGLLVTLTTPSLAKPGTATSMFWTFSPRCLLAYSKGRLGSEMFHGPQIHASTMLFIEPWAPHPLDLWNHLLATLQLPTSNKLSNWN
jgi:hypothetical protein